MKSFNNFFIALCAAVFCLGACSAWDGGDQGSIDINLDRPSDSEPPGGDNSVEPFPDDVKEEYFKNVEYTITLTNGEGARIIQPSGSGAIPIPEGTWDIKVEAQGPRIKGSWFEKDVKVVAGVISKTVKIKPEATRVNSWELIEKDLANLEKLDVGYIEITGNLTATKKIDFTQKGEITLRAEKEKSINIERSFSDGNNNSTLFRIDSNTTLVLGGEDSGAIILDGKKDAYPSNQNALIDVLGGSRLIMYDGVTLTNNTTLNGGGVYVDNGSSFTMYGGTIRGNKVTGAGGGVCVYDEASTFVMEGGSILGNEAADNGGGVSNNGTFTMRGGTISGNTAQNGKGVYLAASQKFFKTGGTIGDEVKSNIGFINKPNGFASNENYP